MCRMACVLRRLEKEAFLLSQGGADRSCHVTAVTPAPTISITPEEKTL